MTDNPEPDVSLFAAERAARYIAVWQRVGAQDTTFSYLRTVVRLSVHSPVLRRWAHLDAFRRNVLWTSVATLAVGVFVVLEGGPIQLGFILTALSAVFALWLALNIWPSRDHGLTVAVGLARHLDRTTDDQTPEPPPPL